jgi:hypothetical protein
MTKNMRQTRDTLPMADMDRSSDLNTMRMPGLQACTTHGR